MLSEFALSEAEQMKLTTKRSKTQFHSSHASGSGVDEGTGVSPGVPMYLHIALKMSRFLGSLVTSDDDQDDDNEQTESDNDDYDFVHLKLSTFDEKERQDKEDKEEEWYDDEAYDEETQGGNDEKEELDEEETNEAEEANELYSDVNVNLEGRDTKMMDALLANSFSVSPGFISNMLNPNTNTGIDSILNLNTESTSLVDVPVTMNVEMPPSSVITLPPPPIPFSQPLQQTPVPTPTVVPSTSLQNLPTFGSLFKFKDKVKALEDDFLEFKQTNLFAKAVSSIPGIVDTYLANKMNEAVKAVVQLQSDRHKEEAQADNEKSVNEQLEAEVLIRSSNKAKTSHTIAANLSELELKKILLDKMEKNKSIDRSVQQKTLYKALFGTYESDKDILASYGENVTLKRHQDDEDEDEEPSAGLDRGSKRRRARKEPESTSAPKEKTSKSTGKSKEGSKSHQKSTRKSAQAEEPIHTNKDLEEPVHQDTLARNKDPRESFNELIDTPLDFLAFVLNRLKVDTLTPELLAGPTFELMKGKLKNLNVEERLALGVSLRMFSRSIVLRRRMEDLLLGVKSYQKKLNLTRPDTYRSDLKQKSVYTAYSNPKANTDEVSATDCLEKHAEYDESNTYVLERFITTARNPVKEILLKLNLPDHMSILTDSKEYIKRDMEVTDSSLLTESIEVKEFQRSFRHSDIESLSRSDEVLKLKNFKKDAALKLFKSTNQERYEHVGPIFTSSQDGKVYKMAKRDYA
ncbi:hypothetical protein Tco_0631774 [Tanacetum coccineum]